MNYFKHSIVFNRNLKIIAMNPFMKSILGALVGDAAGATLEGYDDDITSSMAEHAMTMPGGGPMKVGPGQITDDGELTLTLWSSIEDRHPSNGLPLNELIRGYAAWYDSFPFDVGQTCSLAFDSLSEFVRQQGGEAGMIHPQDVVEIKHAIFRSTKSSQANGALMRSTAIASWVAPYVECTAEQAAEFAMEDASFSHPHPICQETNAIYVYTLVNLLRGISPAQAIDYTNEFVVLNDFSPEAKHWYFNESIDISIMNPTTNIGHVRWAFVLAFYFLRNPSISYEDAIRTTLQKGGDTDTNACIVGGMVACYHPIPDYMLRPVLEFDCTTRSRRRPKEYSVPIVLGDIIKNDFF
jgi:ADP-ribosyl-[dinitrogen reductase] hydrolase